MKEYTTFLNAQALLQRRFDRLSGKGRNLLSLLPHPKLGVVLVGGPRNEDAQVPPQTRNGLNAALRSAARAERALQAKMEREAR